MCREGSHEELAQLAAVATKGKTFVEVVYNSGSDVQDWLPNAESNEESFGSSEKIQEVVSDGVEETHKEQAVEDQY